MQNASTSTVGNDHVCFRLLEQCENDQSLELTCNSLRQYLFLHSGRGEACIDGWQTPVSRGEILFLPAGSHAEIRFTEPAKAFVFGVGEDFLISCVVPALGVSLASYWDDFHSPKKLSQWTAANETAERERIWRELTYAARRIGSCTDAVVAGYVMLILFEKNNRVLQGQSSERSPVEIAAHQLPHATFTLLARFRGLIEQHISAPWSVADYCKALEIRPVDLAAACKDATGRTPASLIQEHKLQRAKRELRTTDASAAEIGYRVGFNDPAYFSRFFRRHTGRSPVEFRREAAMPARGSAKGIGQTSAFGDRSRAS